MAITTGQSNNNNPQQGTTMAHAFAGAGAPSNAGAQAAAAPGNSGGGQPMSFRNISGGIRAPMARTEASEALSRFTRIAEEVLTEAKHDDTLPVVLIPIDREQTNRLAVSVVVVAVRDSRAEHVGVAFHTLLIEASSEDPAPITVNIQGRSIPVDRDLGEAADADMLEVIASEINRRFPGMRQHVADFEKVPRDFKVDDKTAMRALLANAVFAASQEIQIKNPDWRDINLSNFRNSGDQLAIRATFGNPQITDEVGHPVRADIQIDFTVSPPGNPNNGNTFNQNIERVTPLTKVAGFMDMIWAPPVMQQQGWNVQAAPNTQRYRARFVMTRMEGLAFASPAMQLLAMFTATSIAPGNAWVQAFKPSPFKGKGRDLKDIGAVAIETNIENDPSGFGSILDTKADNFGTDRFFKLMMSTFCEGMILSLDVPECGPTTWMNAIFAVAGNSANPDMDAMAAIGEAANILTDGHFERHYQGSGMFVSDGGNRIQLGYFPDQNGVRTDIRDIDYLAIANMSQSDPSVIAKWSDTYSKLNVPLPERLADRRALLRSVTSDHVVFTSYARRIDIETAFLSALAEGIAANNMNIRQTIPSMDVTSFERGTYNVNNLVLGSQQISAFNRGGYAPINNGRAYQAGFTGRSFQM